MLTKEQIKSVAQAENILNAINHPLRLKILGFIEKKGNTNVTPIYKALKFEQSVASNHLKLLRDSGVVVSERNGHNVIYSINEKRVSEISDVVDKFAVNGTPPKAKKKPAQKTEEQISEETGFQVPTTP